MREATATWKSSNTAPSSAMLNGALAVAGDPAESVTAITKLLVPDPVGVPSITPVEAESDSPAGSAPSVTAQV